MDALIQELRDLFHYDPETGIVTRKKTASNQVAGKVVGTKPKDGKRIMLKCGKTSLEKRHLSVRVNRKTYQLHRVIWAIYYGEWPKHFIDHIDGVGDHNWISNLQDVTNQLNMQNKRRAQLNNKLGVLGVFRSRSGKRFVSVIFVNKKRIRLGTFDTVEEASAAYVAAKRKYHENCKI